MTGFYASVELTLRAQNNGSFIECVCLYANQIDALLRIGLILKRQIENDSSELIEELLYQGEDDRKIMERTIYKMALNDNIIDQEIYNRLNALYDERNKVVHRYIISELTTEMVLKIAADYHQLLLEVNDKIVVLEKEQIRTGKGMTLSADQVPQEKRKLSIKDLALEKHGRVDLDRKI